jgi:hypothetical protein
MSAAKYSEFTLNFNSAARGNDKAPTLRGKAKVIDAEGSATEFDVAAWGPNKAQSGGPDFYNVTLTPKDPAHAARQLKTELDGPVPNAIDGFELSKLGTGRLFERSDEQLAAAKQDGKSLPKFFGHALVLLPSARATSICRPGTERSTTSIPATRRCTTAPPQPPRGLVRRSLSRSHAEMPYWRHHAISKMARTSSQAGTLQPPPAAGLLEHPSNRHRCGITRAARLRRQHPLDRMLVKQPGPTPILADHVHALPAHVASDALARGTRPHGRGDEANAQRVAAEAVCSIAGCRWRQPAPEAFSVDCRPDDLAHGSVMHTSPEHTRGGDLAQNRTMTDGSQSKPSLQSLDRAGAAATGDRLDNRRVVSVCTPNGDP